MTSRTFAAPTKSSDPALEPDREAAVRRHPVADFAGAARLLAPVAEVPARTIALNRYLAAEETPWTDVGGGLVDPASMTTVADLLCAKASLPGDATGPDDQRATR